ncbi:FAD-dependent oxidoreductase [Streptomyces sp. NPDC092296]|uniref:FAD-dependent oxidoreductase n=1 Tax=Streptomyces sp. NPDC092296 TaxID=3366012 RepID=UPI0038023E69
MAVDGVVVAGGSLAGLFAALVFAESGAAVTVVERDRLPDGPEFRGGVPQRRHAHLLFEGGLTAFEELLPGIIDELRAAGAVEVGLPGDLEWLTPLGTVPRRPSRRTMLSCTRPLLDWTVRRRVLAHDRISLIQGAEAVGLEVAGRSVRGLRLREERQERTLAASVVVDATGRGSRAPRWLTEAGCRAPAEERVDAGVAYATGLFRRPDVAGQDVPGIYVQTSTQGSPRFGIALRVQQDRWIVALGGMRGEEPPTDPAEFVDFAAGLRSPRLHEVLTTAVPDSPLHGFRPGASRRRHFHRLRDRPAGFLVVGDAGCTFNPVYGQGMTVAARGALALRRVLALRGPSAALGTGIQRAVAREADVAWSMGESEDLRFPATDGRRRSPLLRLQHGYLDRVLRAATADRATADAFIDVLSLCAPPTRLFTPPVLRAVLRSGRPAPE